MHDTSHFHSEFIAQGSNTFFRPFFSPNYYNGFLKEGILISSTKVKAMANQKICTRLKIVT